MPYLSLIVPVYNRPQEVQELLESLAAQDSRDFEIIIVEDGSTVRCDRIVEQYKSAIDIKYFFKENAAQYWKQLPPTNSRTMEFRGT